MARSGKTLGSLLGVRRVARAAPVGRRRDGSAPGSLITLLAPSFYRPGTEDRSRAASGSRKSDRSHRLRVPGRADATRARCDASAARRAAYARKRGNAACQAAQQRTPFHGLLFSTLSFSVPPSLRPMDSIWKITCRNLRRPRSASSARPASDFSRSLSLSLYVSLSPFSSFFSTIACPAGISFRDC